MSVTIEFGWWLIPTAVTLMSFGMGHWYAIEPASTPMGAALDGFLRLVFYGMALIVSLIAWLIWAVAL